MFQILHNFTNLSYKWHLLIAFLVRLVFIIYGTYHDEYSNVKYTDVDYKVFTDASRLILDGKSPYNRHTYRYSPLIAILLIPNVLININFGKLLFSAIDLLVGLLIRILIRHNIKTYQCYCNQSDVDLQGPNEAKMKIMNSMKLRKRHKNIGFSKNMLYKKTKVDLYSDSAMMFWLYNPITITIATRGNCDTIAGLLVLITLYLLQCKQNYFLSGIVHGCAIHLRLYPIAYSLSFYMFLSKFAFYTIDRFKNNKDRASNMPQSKNKNIKIIENKLAQQNCDSTTERRTIFKIKFIVYLLPNLNQLKLVVGCILSLICFVGLFYYLYGYQFLYETYFYHLIRKDARHNFSLYFYLQYLTAGIKRIGLWQKVLMILPQIILVFVFSFRYGINKYSLNFCVLAQTITMVSYNSVLTSQYFVWILVILPLCFWQIQIRPKTAGFFVFIWLAAQAAWLLPAYLLEFQGQNTFFYVWLQSVSLFCANIAILGRLIMYFNPPKQKIQ